MPKISGKLSQKKIMEKDVPLKKILGPITGRGKKIRSF
jgi:hypothetical protein